MRIIELKQQRAKVVEDQRAILAKAESERRNMTADEDLQYRRMDDQYNTLSDEIRRLETLQQRELDLAKLEIDRRGGRSVFDPDSERRATIHPAFRDSTYRFQSNPNGTDQRTIFDRAVSRGLHQLDASEIRTLQADDDVKGGYLAVPSVLAGRVLIAMDNLVHLRGLASVFPCEHAASLGIPTITTDPSAPTWTPEISTGTEDTAMAFGQRALHPHPLAKRIKISNKLLRLSTLNPGDLVMSRLAYVFATTEEYCFMVGTGAQQPLGVFTAATDGIGTDRDVSTGNTATGIAADNLIECAYTLKSQYRRNARWIFHREALKRIRKLKDGNGDYLWRAGIANGEVNTILDFPYLISEYAPSTFTASQYVGILGDFSFYWIADALGMQIQVLDQLYAETNQTGYIGRLECDGMPVLPEAFVRVQLASA